MSDSQTTEPQPVATAIGVDRDEVIRRLMVHPIAAPYVQMVMRDIALEQAYARIAELEQQVGAPAPGAAAARPRSSRPARRKAAAAAEKPAGAGTPPTE